MRFHNNKNPLANPAISDTRSSPSMHIEYIYSHPPDVVRISFEPFLRNPIRWAYTTCRDRSLATDLPHRNNTLAGFSISSSSEWQCHKVQLQLPYQNAHPHLPLLCTQKKEHYKFSIYAAILTEARRVVFKLIEVLLNIFFMCPYLTYLRSAQLFLAVHLRSACVRMCVCLCSFLSALHLACNLHYYTVYIWPLEHTFSAPNPKVNSQPQSLLILSTLPTSSSSIAILVDPFGSPTLVPITFI